MKRSKGNSKKKNQGNNCNLNRKNSENTFNSRKNQGNEEFKLQMQRRWRKEKRDSVAPKQESVVRVKLPKLIITIFNGTQLN